MRRGKAYFMGGPLDGQFRDMPDVYHINYEEQPTLFDDPDAERITYTAVGYGVVGPGVDVVYMRYDEERSDTADTATGNAGRDGERGGQSDPRPPALRS